MAVMAVALLAGACAGPNAEKAARKQSADGRLPAPTYAPVSTTTSATSARTSVAGARGSSTTATTAPADTPTTGATVTTPAAQSSPTESRITDPVGDATRNLAAGNPKWADLAGGRLVRRPDGYELQIMLGAAAPGSVSTDDPTMDISSYYDVDGDGRIDYEIGAILADDGWSTSWYDGRKAHFTGTGVTATAAGDVLTLRFPLDHLGGAATFRWSLASQYGTYEQLGTPVAARDDAPDDDDGAAAFPG